MMSISGQCTPLFALSPFYLLLSPHEGMALRVLGKSTKTIGRRIPGQEQVLHFFSFLKVVLHFMKHSKWFPLKYWNWSPSTKTLVWPGKFKSRIHSSRIGPFFSWSAKISFQEDVRMPRTLKCIVVKRKVFSEYAAKWCWTSLVLLRKLVTLKCSKIFLC